MGDETSGRLVELLQQHDKLHHEAQQPLRPYRPRMSNSVPGLSLVNSFGGLFCCGVALGIVMLALASHLQYPLPPTNTVIQNKGMKPCG